MNPGEPSTSTGMRTLDRFARPLHCIVKETVVGIAGPCSASFVKVTKSNVARLLTCMMAVPAARLTFTLLSGTRIVQNRPFGTLPGSIEVYCVPRAPGS